MPGVIKLANSLLETQILGKGLASPLVVDSSINDFKRVEYAENVKQCIMDLIDTRIGERVMRENVGTEIHALLFESQTAVIDIMPVQIVQAIERYEPRVTRVSAVARPEGDNIVHTLVSWILRATGKQDSLVYPYYLEPAEGGIPPNL